METDALMVKQALASGSYSTMREGGLVEELKFLVASNFIEFECKFMGREGNRVAHALAELGYDL